MAAILMCVLDYHPDPAGGAERQARLQADELARRGHRVTVVCRGLGSARSGVVGDVRVDRLRAGDGRIGRWLHYPRLLAYLVRHAGEHDVVHVHHANLQADVAVLAGRLRRRPVYLKLAGVGPDGDLGRLRRVRRWTGHAAFRRAAAVQASSPQMAAELRAVGVSERRLVEIPNGLPARAFDPVTPELRAAARQTLGLPVDATIVLSLGRFAVEKGTADLLEAWEQLRDDPRLALALVGRPAGLDPVDVASADNVHVVPWLSEPAVALQAADLFVLASQSEGMSNALLEAMAAGLPVISTSVGAGPELVMAAGAGMVVPIRNVPALRAAIVELAADQERRRRSGTAARAAVADLTIERVVDRIEAVYARLLGPSSA